MKIKLLFFLAFAYVSCQAQVCFNPELYLPHSNLGESICNADFNGDDKIDIAFANQSSNKINLYLGKGNGEFENPTTINLSPKFNPIRILNEDFNRDGKQDIAVLSEVKGFAILLDTGLGNFGIQLTEFLGYSCYGFCSGDFNGDTIPDMVVPDINGNFRLYLGSGDGTFIKTFNSFNIKNYMLSVISKDFDVDGYLDLAFVGGSYNNYTDSVSIFFGKGNGFFAAEKKYFTNGTANMVNTADYNGDGRPDLIFGCFNDHILNHPAKPYTATVMFNLGSRNFSQSLLVIDNKGPISIAVADFNGDKKDDFAINDSTSQVAIYLGKSVGGFEASQKFQIDSGFLLFTNNFNADNKPDLGCSNAILLNCTITGITAFDKEPEIKVYPNPSFGDFNIETSTEETKHIYLYDLSGRLLFTTTFTQKYTFESANFMQGYYMLVIKTGKSIFKKSLIIEK